MKKNGLNVEHFHYHIVTDVHGGARNEEAWNFVWNTLFYKHRTEIAGDRYTHRE